MRPTLPDLRFTATCLLALAALTLVARVLEQPARVAAEPGEAIAGLLNRRGA